MAQLEINRGWLSLGLVGPSDTAGWSLMVEGQVYPPSVRALTPMRVARIEASSLARVMELDPRIGYPIHKGMSSVFCRQYQSALDAFKTNR